MNETTHVSLPKSPPRKQDSILEFQAAYDLVRQAKKDNIFVTFHREDGVMVYRVIKTVCKSYAAALAQVRYQQSMLAPSAEVRL